MSKLTNPFLVVITLLISPKTHAQESDYSISTYEEDGFLAPNTHYLGEAWLHFSMPVDSLTGYGITKAMFKANSRLNWHKHGSTQVLIIIDGIGYYQERGKEPVLMKEGDINLIVSPEGTRSYAEKWKSGFYYIAKDAGVDISFGFVDYKNKRAGITKVISPTTLEETKAELTAFYKDIQGKYPEKFNTNMK